MKKLILAVLITLLSATTSWGAAACVHTSVTELPGDALMITETCTAHTDNSLSATVSTTTLNLLKGKYLYNLYTYPGATAPTDASDLVINMTVGAGGTWDILDGTGTNMIDATSTLGFGDAIPFYEIITGALTVVVTNNAVASAITSLVFIAVPERGN